MGLGHNGVRHHLTAYLLLAYIPLYSFFCRIFKQSSEFCSEHDVWKLNVAHTYFMKDNHYKEAIRCG